MTLRRRRTSAGGDERTNLHGGTVTRLAYQKHDPQRVSIYVDDAFALGVHVDVILRHGIRKGMELDVQSQSEMLAEDAPHRAKTAAIKFLGHKPRTAAEVSRRLADKGFPGTVAGAVVADLNESGLLDDERYARDFAASRFSSRGYGPGRIRLELVQRGIDKNLADRVIGELLPDAEVLEAARDHAMKAWERSARETDRQKRRKKVYDYLLRRGFDFEMARAAVDRLDE